MNDKQFLDRFDAITQQYSDRPAHSISYNKALATLAKEYLPRDVIAPYMRERPANSRMGSLLRNVANSELADLVIKKAAEIRNVQSADTPAAEVTATDITNHTKDQSQTPET